MRFLLPCRMTSKQLVLTGSRGPTAEQVDRLQAENIDVIHHPVIETIPVAFQLPPHLDWLIVTSPTGVERITSHLDQLQQTKIAVVGSKTAAALIKSGRTPDFVPSAFTGDVLVEELCPFLRSGQRICFARGNRARQEPLEHLRKQVEVDVLEVVTYETKLRAMPPELLRHATYIGLQSPSAVEALAPLRKQTEAIYVTIGPITEQAAHRFGLTPRLVAQTFTLDGLIDCILEEELL
ncbi:MULTISPECIES: uroporphyrinogen-III synthase [Exiguobacterium]|uniref:uroporphyrinogen-III synthase n=2 Tax=Bacillales Family XII. Incertae Sedis TaxID=539742 RepID=UPI0021C4ACD3|nr:uroporphyrinogen-III synthase [Exiguobacterium soli]MCT4778772.1 uroporphyrinogen-III synthase [Exiguobacterium soli]